MPGGHEEYFCDAFFERAMKDFKRSERPERITSPIVRAAQSVPSVGILLKLLALILPAPAFLVACLKVPEKTPPDGGAIEIKEIDKARLNSTISIAGAFERADIFIYSDSDRTLCEHLKLLPQDGSCASVELWEGDYTAVVICNAEVDFNDAALHGFDSMELLTFRRGDDDDPDWPLSSAMAPLCAGDSIEITPEPLRCTVIINDITNNIAGCSTGAYGTVWDYTRLEDPKVRLEDINPEAEILRSAGFRPCETGICGPTVALPCDIGLFTQYPGTRLLCFPNDSGEAGPGTPRTSLVLECRIRGSTCSFSFPLPPLQRGQILSLSLSIDSENEYFCRIL